MTAYKKGLWQIYCFCNSPFSFTGKGNKRSTRSTTCEWLIR